ncbi:MAG: hypothetical protein IT337_05550 [Thermomicrobiales bacterium]|nr:hypothetical protein [Thermomicrobiales bacterium]
MGSSRFTPQSRRERNRQAAELALRSKPAEPPITPAEAAPDTTPSGVPIRPDLGPPAAGAQPVNQPGSGLGLIASIAVSALVFVLAIYAAGQPTPNRIPLLQTTNAIFWLVAIITVAGAGAAAQYAEHVAARGDSATRRETGESLHTAWIVPAVSTLAAVLLIATFHNAVLMVIGPLIAFLGNAGALLSRDLLDDAIETNRRGAVTLHTLVVHAVAFLAFSAVYLNKLPTPIAAPVIGIIGGLLALELLERIAAPVARRALYALLAGFVMLEATIALNWWRTHGWTGGAVLLVCFYLATGVLLAATQRSQMRTRDLIEYGLVSVLALAVLAFTA